MIGCVLALAACGEEFPSAQSEEAAFIAALQDWYDANPECVILDGRASLPIERAANDPLNQSAIDAGVVAGILRMERLGDDRVRYHPTESGEAALREGDAFFGGVELCYARRRVEAIDGFSDLAGAMGLRARRITYRYSLQEVAPWASNPAITQALPEIADALSRAPSTDTATLVATNDGWVHERALP